MIDSRLEDLVPVLRLDSRERYPPGSAAMMTDCPGNVLKRVDGESLAFPPQLSLDFLHPRIYANGDRVAAGDRIGHEGRDYLGAYEALSEELKAPIVYGRIARELEDEWAQFWFFYWYNDGPSKHEGDWECVQYLLDSGEPPLLAAYAQHRRVETRPWTGVELHTGRPVIYVACETHASYYERPRRSLDSCDGKRMILPRLEAIPEVGWPLWTGRFGDTRGDPERPWESTSPPMPGRTLQWLRPTSWATRERAVPRPGGST